MPRRHSRHAGWAETLQRRRHLYSNRNPEPPAPPICFRREGLTPPSEARNSAGVFRQRAERKKKDSQSTSRCNVIASDSASLPSTTADRAATFAPSARACSSRRSLWCWVSSFPDVLRLRSSASWEDGGGRSVEARARLMLNIRTGVLEVAQIGFVTSAFCIVQRLHNVSHSCTVQCSVLAFCWQEKLSRLNRQKKC